MSFLHLMLRNLAYHWRGNFAVFLGITLGAAVLTGALLVGDSLRGSLKTLTLDQLGWVDEAMVPGRFFRDRLASELPAERKSALLLLNGSAAKRGTKGEQVGRVGRVAVLGIDPSFWPDEVSATDAVFWKSEEAEVVLNHTLAKELDAKVDEKIILNLPRPGHAPGETLLSQRQADRVIEPIQVKVRAIIPDEGMARFSPRPSPTPTRNAFVPIRLLQKKLELDGKANAILVGQPDKKLPDVLQEKLTLADWGLRYRSPEDRALAFVKYLDPNDINGGNLRPIRWASNRVDEKEIVATKKLGWRIYMDKGTTAWKARVPDPLVDAAEKNKGILTKEAIIAFFNESRGYWVLESTRMLIPPMVIKAMEKIAPNDPEAIPRFNWNPMLIYLADSITDGKIETPYAIVAGDDVFEADAKKSVIGDDQILLMNWPGSPFKVNAKTEITLKYFKPNERNELVKSSATFKIHSTPPKIEGVYDDPDLTPEFPGITDKLDIAAWENPPFPFDPKRAKAGDDFWKRYKTTPRAYINLKKAQELWGTRFGNVTSIQVRGGQHPANELPEALLKELKAADGGFSFQPIRKQALDASSGATDFGVLFLAFSFFLIAAALLLVGLLVRLNIDRRAGEMGLLLAIGWTNGGVRLLLLGEGAILAILGGIAGLAGAALYANLMLKLLSANWPGGGSLNFLRLHAEPTSFTIGYGASVAVSLLTLVWATRVLGGLSPRALLHGETTSEAAGQPTSPIPSIIVIVSLLAALAMIVAGMRVTNHELQAGMFFGSGAMLLTAAITGVLITLRRLRQGSTPQPTLTRLGIRNAARHAARSVLTVGLLASASFLIVAVESFHKGADTEFVKRTGGSGGFAFFAEGSLPVFEDLNVAKVRQRHELDKAELRHTTFYACRVQQGDDASCLNLYKPIKPRVMGLPQTVIERGGFAFASSKAETEDEKKNPWLLLNKEIKGAVPAIIDANTAQWILKVSLGDDVEIRGDQGEMVKLRIVGLLKESMFQSEMLIAETSFLKLFPHQEGASFFLVDVGDENADPKTIEKQLAEGLDDFGLDVQTTASRLEGYLAVENMYLATFQALGGLGLVLGAVGLAIVLLRGVWERRAELALMLALGFRPSQLAWLVLVENVLLLKLGLLAGTIAALLAVGPHLVGAGAQVLWLRIAGLLALVLVVGLASAALAIWSTLRTPVLTGLRRE